LVKNTLIKYTGFANIDNITFANAVNYINLYSTYTVKFDKLNEKTNVK